jgi:sterol desaturase/sphingolipid hydroxylase (fatty acid hydroxylase superfamily)
VGHAGRQGFRLRPHRAAALHLPSSWVRGGLPAAALLLLVAAERRWPLRPGREPGWRHTVRNLAFSAVSALSVGLVETPLVSPLSRRVQQQRLGLLPRLGLPSWAEQALGVALMDYTLYLWHVLTHRVPLLWRFHRVHHADLKLEATTALRFHFGELLLSVPWRAAQVRLLGVGPRTLALWQTALTVSILFHHSNLRLPKRLERQLSRLVVTPRLHGIHHSVREEERNANWSSGLMLWDWLHGTSLRGVPQRALTLGVPGLPEPLPLWRMLTLPLTSRGAGPPLAPPR